MSQQNFAKVLGFGAKTITRYENGSIQDVAHDNLMKLVENEYNFYKIWNKNKVGLTNNTNKKVQKSFIESNDFEFNYDNSFIHVKYINDEILSKISDRISWSNRQTGRTSLYVGGM